VSEAQRPRRKRGSISQEEIIEAALRLMDGEGEAALTFARLGKELQAAPTAVYRHFSSRQDLERAIADHLDGLSIAGYEPTDDWRADLAELAWRAWRTAVAHPAAAAASLWTVTNGPNELQAVEWVLRALHVAGLRGEDAVIQYNVYANLVLGSSSAYAAKLAETRDPSGWMQVYAPKDPSQFPHAESLKAELAAVDYEVVFAKELEMYLDALEALVQRSRERTEA